MGKSQDKKGSSSPKASVVIKPKPQKEVDTSKVELVSYMIRAVIPTGPYANIQPEVVVKAKSLEEAEAYVVPHINKLFGDFLNRSEKRNVEVKVEEKERVVDPKPQNTVVEPTAPFKTEIARSEPYTKANNAINGAMSREALDILEDQIHNSVRLTPEEKPELLTAVLYKRKEFN